MLRSVSIQCPYCGEPIELTVDAGADRQDYIEDCSVCCRPIEIGAWIDTDGAARVEVAAQDD